MNFKLPFVLSTHVCSKRFCSHPVNPPTVLSIERAVCRRVWRSSECASELAPSRICPASRSLPLVQGHPQPPLGVRGAPRLVPVRPLPRSPPGHTSTCTPHTTVAGCTVFVHSSFPGPRLPKPHERAKSAPSRGGECSAGFTRMVSRLLLGRCGWQEHLAGNLRQHPEHGLLREQLCGPSPEHPLRTAEITFLHRRTAVWRAARMHSAYHSGGDGLPHGPRRSSRQALLGASVFQDPGGGRSAQSGDGVVRRASGHAFCRAQAECAVESLGTNVAHPGLGRLKLFQRKACITCFPEPDCLVTGVPRPQENASP